MLLDNETMFLEQIKIALIYYLSINIKFIPEGFFM